MFIIILKLDKAARHGGTLLQFLSPTSPLHLILPLFLTALYVFQGTDIHTGVASSQGYWRLRMGGFIFLFQVEDFTVLF
jgi:hypothetical protein